MRPAEYTIRQSFDELGNLCLTKARQRLNPNAIMMSFIVYRISEVQRCYNVKNQFMSVIRIRRTHNPLLLFLEP